MLRFTLTAAVLLILSGCYLNVISPRGGEVQSISSGTCLELTNCLHEITDSTYTEEFTAVPDPGFRFVRWSNGDRFLCADSTDPTCLVSSTQFASQISDATIDAAGDIYIMPVFKKLNSLRLFVTANEYSGNLGGIDGADAKCNDTSDANHPGDGVYKAILIGGGRTAVPLADWALKAGIDYVRPDGTFIAEANDNAVFDFSFGNLLANPITISQLFPWTGVGSENWETSPQYTCSDWSSADATDLGIIGVSNATWSGAFFGGGTYCNETHPLYCAEQ